MCALQLGKAVHRDTLTQESVKMIASDAFILINELDSELVFLKKALVLKVIKPMPMGLTVYFAQKDSKITEKVNVLILPHLVRPITFPMDMEIIAGIAKKDTKITGLEFVSKSTLNVRLVMDLKALTQMDLTARNA